MSRTLQQEIQQKQAFTSLEEEAFLDLQRTASLVLQAFARELRAYDLTAAQYNTLRILRGAGGEALTCGDIGERLVTPGPDVTRLLDRLEGRGLVARLRDEVDRRVVRARITDQGMALLAELDRPVEQELRRLLAPLGEERLQTLIQLLDRIREGM
jgi:DNA-binding MarR family transcriptional regulator